MKSRISRTVAALTCLCICLSVFGCTIEDYRLVKAHRTPEWFHDAKFGILVHWGPYSVPGWAPLVEPGDPFKPGFFKTHPYAEWYWNTLKIEGSPTRRYHAETYGADYSYYNFGETLKENARGVDTGEWADVFEDAGARYVVITAKHHDGFCLWPTAHENPMRPGWHLERDLVGDLCDRVRARGMRMGIYYSGGLDWTFTEDMRITDIFSMFYLVPQSRQFIEYTRNHWYELIDRYRPDILWGDIAVPLGLDRWALWAHYYRVVPDGAINERWAQTIRDLVVWLLLPAGMETVGPLTHFDFFTPEYQLMKRIRKLKWETCRGIGWSFAYNRQEEVETGHLLSAEGVVEMLADIVSKNGNLFLDVGPRADGSIPEVQLEVLRGVGEWLRVNGDAIYGTRPWVAAEGSADGGSVRVRFTQKGPEDTLYAILLDTPVAGTVTIGGITAAEGTTVRLLGREGSLEWSQEDGGLAVSLPEGLGDAPAYALAISPRPAHGPGK